MNMQQKKERAVISTFQKLVRCGKDYDVDYMYGEAGKRAFLTQRGARNIINRYYQGVITAEMIRFVSEITGTAEEKAEQFMRKFNVCKREAILIIPYIKRKR